MSNKIKQKYRVLSLFSGAMGLDLGLEATGRFTTVACIEKESAFCETIRKNRDAGRLSKDLRVLEADISQLDPAAVFENFNIDPQSIDVVVGGLLPAKQFSSMETSAGRMVEEVVLPEYGWKCVASEMHTSNSALDGARIDGGIYRLATLKSGPRCLNDEMSENFADSVLGNYQAWAKESGVNKIDFTYGVLYGTQRLSNKKDWHILKNIRNKAGAAMTVSPDEKWTCQFRNQGISVDVTVRIGLDWWEHLGGELCFVEVFTALIRACINAGSSDPSSYRYTIADLGGIVSILGVREEFNVSLLQRSQSAWLFLMARHFCDELVE